MSDATSESSTSALEQLEREIEHHARLDARYSVARLLGFGLLVASFAMGWLNPILALICPLALLVAFVYLVIRHDGTRKHVERLRARRTLLEERDARQARVPWVRQAPVGGEEGNELEQGQRVFAPEPTCTELDSGILEDLEVLRGPRTLFGFASVCNTVFGERRLRWWLSHPLLAVDAIRERQETVAELQGSESRRLRLLEHLFPLRSHSFEPVYTFFRGRGEFEGRRGLAWFATLSGTLLPLILVGCFWAPPLLLLALPQLLIHLGFIGYHGKRANPARTRMLLFRPLLSAVLDLGEELEREPLTTTEGARLCEVFRNLEGSARALARRLARLELMTHGVVFQIINLLTLLELRSLPRAETILLEHKDELIGGVAALGEVEAYLSLATVAAEFPDFVRPEPESSEEPRVVASGLGHPLLPRESRVRNPLELQQDERVAIITGSNMAGKSTYLKSVGANLVLAGVGSVVCAESFAWTPVELRSDVNVRDSLDDGKSYFQVEVERVREILESAKQQRHLLAIFDELFRGTNSVERRAIARAILRSLRDAGVLVIAATHDIDLTHLVTRDAEPGMANYHFQERVGEGGMSFDYRLRSGPAPSRNAIQVLESIGYPPEVVADARFGAQLFEAGSAE